ncbi:hypothetical protein CY34DRAFT_725615 [Suillus luteus UH-Slu-Lm8-n1]|uniref:Uncharacterized protein n=1 Tax=Suillus luteus UH-Slu-Lm8-n1 TaxID=930992 RepID=A0A0D0B9Y0_9AGAM|nr:hypothetical protein CY34DRAFT_725615 [Suillus luteus UH-Slu-Lm8-n1]
MSSKFKTQCGHHILECIYTVTSLFTFLYRSCPPFVPPSFPSCSTSAAPKTMWRQLVATRSGSLSLVS